jgi:putative Ca2+/H+ antiporter (TMEM165/GDT1 family)
MLVMFNKNQSEGLAKVVDNLATASIVAVIVGGFVDNKINFVQGIVLVVVAVTFLVIAYILRRGEDDGN